MVCFFCFLIICFRLGVSIIEDGGGSITMELEMNWDGNPSIVLDIKTRLGVALPVQVLWSFLPFFLWLNSLVSGRYFMSCNTFYW